MVNTTRNEDERLSVLQCKIEEMFSCLVRMHAHHNTALSHNILGSFKIFDFISFMKFSHAVIHVAARVYVSSQGDSVSTGHGKS